MKVLVATEKPFAAVAVNGIREEIENAGYEAGVYASRSWYNQNLEVSKLDDYRIWLAEYRSTPLYSGYYDMWQYTSKGSVDGIAGNVDLNISYMGK